MIVGIHGLASKPPKETLSEWWETSIREGLSKNCAWTRSISSYWEVTPTIEAMVEHIGADHLL